MIMYVICNPNMIEYNFSFYFIFNIQLIFTYEIYELFSQIVFKEIETNKSILNL